METNSIARCLRLDKLEYFHRKGIGGISKVFRGLQVFHKTTGSYFIQWIGISSQQGGYFLGMKGIPKRQKRYFTGGEGISRDEISEISILGRVATTGIYAPKGQALYSHYPLGVVACMADR